MSNFAGQIIGDRYRLLRQVAVGGMGEVWTARDQVTRRKVAAKVLKPELAGQSIFLARLRMEARNTMQINHPNLTAVLDHGEEDGVGWIIMEYVEGRPFNQYLANGNRISPDQLIPVLIQTAYALSAAQKHDVVHRDIKPSNIMVTAEGIVKLTDFGISVTPNQTSMTDAGMVMGTAQYLPPEQAMGEPATHAGDLYALGVIAYEALAGHRPFTGKTQVDVAFAHVNEPVPPLPEDVPTPLARVVMQLLRKKPDDRPHDATALVRELNQVAKQLDVGTSPTPISLPDDADTGRGPVTTPMHVPEAKNDTPAKPSIASESNESAPGATPPDGPGAPAQRQPARPRRSTAANNDTRIRHASTDPFTPRWSELIGVALVVLIASLLLYVFAHSLIDRAYSPDLNHPVSQPEMLNGSLEIHTLTEVTAW
ncbi:MAG: protein kinase [Actinomycetaceae bacterium]|nr:protein kinase [Actinomycetaceae bacterium]